MKWVLTIGGILVFLCVVLFLLPSTDRQRVATLAAKIDGAGAVYYFDNNAVFPPTENKALAEVLLGSNPKKKAYLSLSKEEMSTSGEIIDCWGTPLRFDFQPNPYPCTVCYAVLRVVSAGPDKIFETPDDITWSSPRSDHP